ncbi:serine/threonine-protein kinase Nek6-like [Clytia hemisphaerica]|uniref:Protein kinase domain-containing protein n=1 Tax=Clytia hemisphaerica TaxID=252671 RepID=A0A7M5UXV5_9CNID|eukprot:TCONS_00011809-protein
MGNVNATNRWEDRYEKISELGRGYFGVVYKAKRFNIEYYAVKEVNNVSELALQEIKILKDLEHKNIVQFFEHFINNGQLAIVMEYADEGTMLEFRKNLSHQKENELIKEDVIWEVMKQLASPLDYLHQNRIMHRDLKPDNILCFSDQWNELPIFKLSDFGISKHVDGDTQQGYYTGTQIFYACSYTYAAPEVIKGQNYTFSADMWSLGALISFWFNGKHLFTDVEDVLEWEGETSTLSRKFSKFGIRTAVAILLDPDYHNRPDVDDVLSLRYD